MVHRKLLANRNLRLETLELRQLLAASVLASAEGTVLAGSDGSTPAAAELELTIDPATPRALIGLLVSPGDAESSLDPQAAELMSGTTLIPSVWAAADIHSGRRESLVLADVRGGETYNVVVRGQSNSAGSFRLDVLLPGDVTGDAAVSESELMQASATVVQSQFGVNHVGALFFRQKGLSGDLGAYEQALDANLDGSIGAVDLDFVGRNLGVANVSVELVSDEQPPAIQAAVDPDTGRLDDDGLTNDPQAVIAGTITDASAVVTLTGAVDDDDASAFVDLLTADFLDGQDFAAEPEFTLSLDQLQQIAGTDAETLIDSGPHTLYLLATDELGNTLQTPVAISFQVDTQAPAAPAQPVLTGGDTGAISDTTPTFTIAAGEDVLVRLFSSLVAGPIGEAVGSGTVTITASELTEGAHQITATATDRAGNVSPASQALQVVIDTGDPDLEDFAIVPATTQTDPQGNPLTPNANVSISGTTETGATVQLLKDGQLLGTTTAPMTARFHLPMWALPLVKTPWTW